MAKTYNRLKLDVNVKPYDLVTAVQVDSDSRYLDVNLFNNGVPIDLTGHEVRIYMRKPENSGEIFNNGEITEPKNGRCQFLLTTAALEKTGHIQTQISIWKDNKEILSTQIFEIDVTESLRTTGSIEGSNEYGALVVLFQNLYESMDLMTDMVQNFGTAGAVAAGIPADTFWKMLEAVYSVNKEALENASVSEVLNRIGSTRDTGGSQTAGTVMGKENAIMKMLEAHDSKIKGNMILKQTQTRTIQKSSGRLNIDFDFSKPVRIVGAHIRVTKASSSSSVTIPAYIINGEDSFTTNFLIPSSGSGGTGVFMRDNSGEVGFFVASDGAFKLIPDIWATKLTFQIWSGVTTGSNVYTYVIYQEEG